MFPNCYFNFCFVTAFNVIAKLCCSPLISQQSHIPIEPHHIHFPILQYPLITVVKEGEDSDSS